MPNILPISDLRNNFNAISDICHEKAEPVYITKNGKGDLVVMSLAYYKQLESKLELYDKLAIAESESENNAPKIAHQDLMNRLRSKIHE